MPRFIYKPRQDADEYIIFSTIVDAPVSGVMTRAEMLDRLTTRGRGGFCSHPETPLEAAESLARADAVGSSLIDEVPLWDTNVSVTNLPAPYDVEFRTCAHRDLGKLAQALADGDTEMIGRITSKETQA